MIYPGSIGASSPRLSFSSDILWGVVIEISAVLGLIGALWSARRSRWIQGYRTLVGMVRAVRLDSPHHVRSIRRHFRTRPPGWPPRQWQWWRIMVVHHVQKLPQGHRQAWRIWWRIWQTRHVRIVPHKRSRSA